jgi:subtilisin family serine protease
MRYRLARALAVALGAALTLAAGAGAANHVVLYKQHAVPADAATSIALAGGTLVHAYPEIGVAIAASDDPAFAATIRRDRKVAGASATDGFVTRLDVEALEAEGPPPGDLPNAPATDADTLSPLQWDMRQIHTPEAHAITGGSPAVTVGILDTGVDKDHPDLVQNIDFAKSASCESGAPVSDPAAWDDRNGHGTHTGGTVAAANNGFGITGVAPNVKIAAVKSSLDSGFFFPEMVVCAFMWSGIQHMDVTNNSYFADPFYFNCMNDHLQHAIWKAEYRAARFAMQEGVTHVAASGNFSDDLAHPTRDIVSPDFPPGSEEERRVRNNCKVMPVEAPGVIGVNANSNRQQTDDNEEPDYLKSFYSNYGVGVSDVVAPGGDSIFGQTPESVNGRVLSTWPAEIPCTRFVQDPPPPPAPTAVYCYLQGTSMASPHAAGVAALIVSRFGDADNPQNGHMRPGAVQARLEQTSDPQPCPTALPAGYAAFTSVANDAPQECQGNGNGYSSWYGHGQINAFRAVTHSSGN